MLSLDLKPITRKWAVALIILNLVRISTTFMAYFQTENQLTSPFISKMVALDVVAPYMIVGLIAVAVAITAFIFYVYSKFTFAIIVCLLNLGAAQFYLVFLNR